MKVRDFVNCACRPEKITALMGNEEFELVDINTYGLSKTLLDMLGDYAVEDFVSIKPNEYSVWIMQRPVKDSELKEAV